MIIFEGEKNFGSDFNAQVESFETKKYPDFKMIPEASENKASYAENFNALYNSVETK